MKNSIFFIIFLMKEYLSTNAKREHNIQIIQNQEQPTCLGGKLQNLRARNHQSKRGEQINRFVHELLLALATNLA